MVDDYIPYGQGITAGHAYYRKGIDTGEWEDLMVSPFEPGSKDDLDWHRGYDHACDDADAAYCS